MSGEHGCVVVCRSVQALSLYRDAGELCRWALERRPASRDDDDDDDDTFLRDMASRVSSRARNIEETLVSTIERHLLARNGLGATARHLANSAGNHALTRGGWGSSLSADTRLLRSEKKLSA